MSNDPLINFAGVVTRDPVTKETPKGDVVTFGVAVTTGYDQDAPAKFYDVAVWNEGLQASVKAEIYKGAKVAIEGFWSSRTVNDKTYHNVNGVKVGLVEWLARSKRQPKASDAEW